MPERKTVGQLMEEMRLKAGAQNYHGHEYMDLERFAEDTRHMIIREAFRDWIWRDPERRQTLVRQYMDVPVMPWSAYMSANSQSGLSVMSLEK